MPDIWPQKSQKFISEFSGPQIQNIPVAARQRLKVTENKLQNLSAKYEIIISEFLHDQTNIFSDSRLLESATHRLSEHFVLLNGTGGPEHGSRDEIGIVSSLCDEFKTPLGCESIYRAIVMAKPESITCSSHFRRSNVRTKGDKFGNISVFPEWRKVQCNIENLCSRVLELSEDSPLLASIVCLSGMQSIHPFPDGNGRASRVLFNFLVRKWISAAFFVPIAEIAQVSRGGLLIRIKDATYNSNWGDVIFYFCDIIDWSLLSFAERTGGC